MMNLNRLLSYGVICLMLGLTSCIDDNYDFDDVDMTLGVKTDLALPTSSVGDILLKSVLNLEEEGIVQLVPNPLVAGQEMYVVKQSGVADIKPVKISEIKIKAPTVQNFSSDVPLKQYFDTYKAKGYKTRAVSAVPSLEHQTFVYTIGEDQAKQTITPSVAGNISEDVVSISDVRFDDATVTLNLSAKGFPSHIDKIHFDDMTLSLPEDLHVTSCTLDGVAAKSIAPGLIKLTERDDAGRSVSKEHVLKLTIDKATVGKAFTFEASRHEAAVSGTFKLGGSLRIETMDMDNDAIMQKVADYLKQNPAATGVAFADVPGVVPDNVVFTGNTKFDNDIRITHISGTFQHEVGAVSPIRLDDIPDFLDDDDVVLDLENPMVFVAVSNSLPADITTGITLSSETDNNTPRSTGELTIAKNKTTEFFLAEKKDDRFLPAEHIAAEWKKVNGLPSLIKRIPKQVNVSVAKVTMEANDLDITREYPIGVNYDVYAPLIFGDDFSLTYTDTDRDWNISDDLAKMNADAITATAKVSSNLPASMTLKIDLIDAKGKKIDTVEDIAISCGANAVDEPISVTIKAKQGHELREILSGYDSKGNRCEKLDGMRYRAVLDNPSAGQPLDGSAKILIKDVKVSLKGVVTYDAN